MCIPVSCVSAFHVLCTAAHNHGTYIKSITPCACLGACFLVHTLGTFLWHCVCSVSFAGPCQVNFHGCAPCVRTVTSGITCVVVGACSRAHTVNVTMFANMYPRCVGVCVCVVRDASSCVFSGWHVSVTSSCASTHFACACQSRMHISRLMLVCDIRLSSPVVLCQHMQASVSVCACACGHALLMPVYVHGITFSRRLHCHLVMTQMSQLQPGRMQHTFSGVCSSWHAQASSA